MLFNSLEYVLFVLVVISLFWGLGRFGGLRLGMLMVASWIFYMTWSPIFIGLIIGSTVFDYYLGLAIHQASDPRRRKRLVTASVVGNLGLLGVFKYFDFFMEASQDTVSLFGGPELGLPQLDLILPVGISFYTFQTMSYTIDIYRGQLQPTRNFVQFATFVSFFPQLVAGPIVRARDLLPQLAKPALLSRAAVGTGIYLILSGMLKKVVVADYVAINLVDRVFENPHLYTATETLVALYGYTVQIYCDFSGYSDVAIGTGMLMGYRLPDNFDRPYNSGSPAEFWRKWHMTLSTWLRDYLYFPLGGSRKGEMRMYVNLFLTLFLIGIWHGASWVFVLYGLLHASAVVLHRISMKIFPAPKDAVDPWPKRIGKIALMFHFTVLSRILFRAPDLDTAGGITERLFSGTFSVDNVTIGVWIAIAGAMFLHWTPKSWREALKTRIAALPPWSIVLVIAVAGACIMEVATSEVVPYIYFAF